MTAEETWTRKLRKFSLLDFALVKFVYFLFGLWVLQIYPLLGQPDWWFWLVLGVLAGFPILLHWSVSDGNFIDKSRTFIATNRPSLQVLLFFSQLFVGVALGILFPVLVNGPWWLLPGLICLAAIKPMTKTMLW